MRSVRAFLILNSSFFIALLAGCFNEPEPASKSVPAEKRIYLSDQGLKDLETTQIFLGADYLNLDRNQLTNIACVAGMAELKWLRLNSNRLTALPDLKGLVNLRRIYLRENRLTAVPETLKDLPALTDIDLSWNPIEAIPDWLAAKKGLKNLSFSGTKVKKLPDDLSAWRSLQCLQLGNLDLLPEEMARIRKAIPDVAIVF